MADVAKAPAAEQPKQAPKTAAKKTKVAKAGGAKQVLCITVNRRRTFSPSTRLCWWLQGKKGKKSAVKFTINCAAPVDDEIFDISAFVCVMLSNSCFRPDHQLIGVSACPCL